MQLKIKRGMLIYTSFSLISKEEKKIPTFPLTLGIRDKIKNRDPRMSELKVIIQAATQSVLSYSDNTVGG